MRYKCHDGMIELKEILRSRECTLIIILVLPTRTRRRHGVSLKIKMVEITNKCII